MRIPGFCGPTYQSASPNIDAEDAINIFCEQSESQGAKVPIAMLYAPGKKLFCQLPESGVYSIFEVNGRAFAAGANLYELFADGTFVGRGPMGANPGRPTQMASNETQLVAMNNGNLFVLTLATNVFTAVNMGQFNGPVSQIGFADGYIIATLQNSHTFQQSNLEDATTWSGLNVATVSLFPDNFTSMICDHREVWFYSGKKTAVYYNSGAGFPVFIPVQGGFLEGGAGAAFATVQMDNSVFWLGQDERGWMTAQRANGYAGQRISTHAIELAWQSYGLTAANAIGYSYQEEGHTFWVIRFPGQKFSWCYDVASGFWHKRAFYNPVNGEYESDHSQCHAFVFGLHLVGDWSTGNVYVQANTIYQDNGQSLRWLRRSPTMAEDNKWLFYSEFELDLETGLTPVTPLVDGDGNPRPVQVSLRWSNDAAKTWSATYLLNCGMPGQFKVRARKMQLGRGRKRVWECSGTDPIPWRIADAYVKVTPSTRLRAAA